MKVNKITLMIMVAAMASLICLHGKVSQAGDSSVPTNFATIQAAIDDAGTVAGDTITVLAGTFSEASIHITKGVTIAGSGTGATFIETTSSNAAAVFIDADDVTIKDLTIQPGSSPGPNAQGIRFEMASSTIDNTEINNVHILNHPSRGIEVHNATTVTDLRLIDSLFEANQIGIRWASNAIGDGVLVDGCTFKDHTDPGSGIGIYQANDSSTGFVQNLTVTDSTFINNGFAGIFGEELRDIEVTNSTFTDNLTGFHLFRIYTTAGISTGDISIHDNTFTDSRRAAVLIDTDAFELPITIEDNIISADVGVLLALSIDKGQQIALRLNSGFTQAPVTVRGNCVNFFGSFGAATAAYAIEVRGDFSAGLTITENTLQGNGVGNNGGVPPTSGILLMTSGPDPFFWGSPTSGSIATVDGCNRITGFVNGVSVYDEDNAAFGGLPVGVQFNVNNNNISRNSSAGINNGTLSTSETIDATNNWWGASDGPSGNGLGSGDAVSANVDFDPWLNAPCEISKEITGKEITDGPDEDGEGGIDLVVEVGKQDKTSYCFEITYDNTCALATGVLIVDTVPAEWQVITVAGNTIDDGFSTGTPTDGNGGTGVINVFPANKKPNNKSATKIEWTPDTGLSNSTIEVCVETRGKNSKHSKFAPTSCGPLFLNEEGAEVFELDPSTGEPRRDPSTGEKLPPLFVSNILCLAAVEDLNGGGIVGDGSGDEDGDGVSDLEEACENGTDPCDPNSN